MLEETKCDGSQNVDTLKLIEKAQSYKLLKG